MNFLIYNVTLFASSMLTENTDLLIMTYYKVLTDVCNVWRQICTHSTAKYTTYS